MQIQVEKSYTLSLTSDEMEIIYIALSSIAHLTMESVTKLFGDRGISATRGTSTTTSLCNQVGTAISGTGPE
jgi:hypothetical protein